MRECPSFLPSTTSFLCPSSQRPSVLVLPLARSLSAIFVSKLYTPRMQTARLSIPGAPISIESTHAHFLGSRQSPLSPYHPITPVIPSAATPLRPNLKHLHDPEEHQRRHQYIDDHYEHS
ncbi:hypothetical protein E2C01_070495 [Portunus trituberculatus]|uniref:Uncharacterized protein n=1 Tax=Portunus trituberculatus TaxID=210409 RepID=A0A5B7HSV6_PORTR|nr:hypothetical protein [Portunus trituberculatus]